MGLNHLCSASTFLAEVSNSTSLWHIILDIPDSNENARVFGRPGSRPGTRAAFPKALLVILVEAGTHLQQIASK
jgi:hypothetical protein